MVFPRESEEGFFTGHVAAFQELRGVPESLAEDGWFRFHERTEDN